MKHSAALAASLLLITTATLRAQKVEKISFDADGTVGREVRPLRPIRASMTLANARQQVARGHLMGLVIWGLVRRPLTRSLVGPPG